MHAILRSESYLMEQYDYCKDDEPMHMTWLKDLKMYKREKKENSWISMKSEVITRTMLA